ncbi:hypothetical protein EDB84DRAFT_1435653 [Lactarius hengduanensis]|nr:hypothetical protein EDB84DRAFT_1435653 [Lactarius hengduanensis]
MPSTSFQPILSAAFADYAEETGIDPAEHPFSDELQTYHRLDDTIKLLEDKANEFKKEIAMNVIHAFSGVLGEAISSSIATRYRSNQQRRFFVGVDVLLAPAVSAQACYDALVGLFDCAGNFLKGLRIHTNLPSTPSM